jgi:predicted nucleic acid-binding protein
VIILDTNVVSALMTDAVQVEPWLRSVARQDLYLTVMTRAEIRYGIARLPGGRRQLDLARRADRLFAETGDRLLTFDARAADRYGDLVAGRVAAGQPMSVPDAIIASIAFVHRASIATRNVRDFAMSDVEVVNPFNQ